MVKIPLLILLTSSGDFFGKEDGAIEFDGIVLNILFLASFLDIPEEGAPKSILLSKSSYNLLKI